MIPTDNFYDKIQATIAEFEGLYQNPTLEGFSMFLYRKKVQELERYKEALQRKVFNDCKEQKIKVAKK